MRLNINPFALGLASVLIVGCQKESEQPQPPQPPQLTPEQQAAADAEVAAKAEEAKKKNQEEMADFLVGVAKSPQVQALYKGEKEKIIKTIEAKIKQKEQEYKKAVNEGVQAKIQEAQVALDNAKREKQEAEAKYK